MKKKPQNSSETEKLTRDLVISPSTKSTSRISGSYSSVVKNARRIDDDDFPGDFPDRGDPPPPRPQVSSPDLAFQFRPALEEIDVPELEEKVISAITAVYGSNADIRYDGSSGVGIIGIWFRASLSDEDDQARDRGLQAVSILQDAESFAIFINSSYVKAEANRAWQDMPKILNGDFKPDTNGPVHLTSFSVAFQSPDTIITKLGGFDERPWPDVDFVFTIKDIFDVSSAEITVDSSDYLDVDTSVLNLLTGVLLILLPPLGLVFLTENIIVRVLEGEQEDYNDGGVGKRIASTLPKEIMIEGGQKLIFLYSRAEISVGGIFGGGVVLPVQRTPSVDIRGPLNLTSDSGSQSVTKKFKAITEDLRGNLRYRWRVNGAPVSTDTKSPYIRFALGDTEPGQVITKTLSLTVTDADGLSASAEEEVKIYISLDDFGLPPICRTKPYLPQCRPPR